MKDTKNIGKKLYEEAEKLDWEKQLSKEEGE